MTQPIIEREPRDADQRASDAARVDAPEQDDQAFVRTPSQDELNWLTVGEPVALRQLSDPRSATMVATRARGFILRTLLVALVLSIAVTGFNWYVDPLGEVRAGGVTSRLDARDKLDLIDEWDAAPQLLVLGSSTMMKYDPRDIERITGRTAFNAGLTGAQPIVQYAIAAYVAEQHPDDMPNLVLGVSHFSFHSGQSAWVKQDRRTSRVLDETPLRERIKTYAKLASVKLVGSSVQVLRGRAGAMDDEASGVDGTASDYRRVAKNGFLLREYPDDPATVAKITASHVGRYGLTFDSWVEDGGRLDAEQRRYFEQAIGLANEHGHTPVVVLTQLSPAAREALAGTGLAAQEAIVGEYMEQLQERLDFTLVDVRSADAFDAGPADFYDATHISADAAARIIERIDAAAQL